MTNLIGVLIGALTFVMAVGAVLVKWGAQMGRDAERLRSLEELAKVHTRVSDVEDTLQYQVLHRPYVTRYPEHQAARDTRIHRPGRNGGFDRHDDRHGS